MNLHWKMPDVKKWEMWETWWNIVKFVKHGKLGRNMGSLVETWEDWWNMENVWDTGSSANSGKPET